MLEQRFHYEINEDFLELLLYCLCKGVTLYVQHFNLAIVGVEIIDLLQELEQFIWLEPVKANVQVSYPC